MDLETLKARAVELETGMNQLVANYNIMQGQRGEVLQWIEKMFPGVATIVDGVDEMAEGAAHVIEGVIEVASEFGVK